MDNARAWTWAAVAIVPLVAGCNDSHCDSCFFPPPSEVSAGLVAGNFSNNGHTSVISTSTVLYCGPVNSGNLKGFLSTGAGTFATPVLTPDDNDPLYLASADVNGDNLPDVVSASFHDSALAVFLNNAQSPGTFVTPILLNSPGASQVAIGDLNGDGLADIVSADFKVSLFVQTAPGKCAAAVGPVFRRRQLGRDR